MLQKKQDGEKIEKKSACALVWHKQKLSLHQKTNKAMKNTEYNLDTLENVISSESFRALLDMIGDLGLEVTGVTRP